ncbi:hypothetical protein QBC38DRAFT_211504 [Podospora fimiseda]|uniref:Uncharacterized protein n=1 Tax=Podospora fimiseda TaxID=252190 RepID=A0AAN7GXZ5_9PEZI|nr:hypothetical protein QBC38DRAFT_211504 [Podospora fimiseda]
MDKDSSSSSSIFFLSWELWQQMTFVLAMAIVAVFAAGLVKLWWNNRLMHKQEIIDEEKRHRLEEMRRTGLPIKRANEIPFGVRAIQKGVEVDGIWISRPTSYLGEKEKLVSSSTTTTLLDSEKKGAMGTGLHSSIYGTTSTASRTATPMSKFNVASRKGNNAASGLNEDALRKLEGGGGGQGRVASASSSLPAYETYVPTSSASEQLPRRQASASSESVASERSYETSSSRNSQRLYMATNSHYQGPVRVQTPSGYVQAQPPPSQQEQLVSLAPVEPTFGPGDLHLNRSSRRVNSGFEILPAGTFGSVAGVGMGEEEDLGRRNKLKKRGAEQVFH